MTSLRDIPGTTVSKLAVVGVTTVVAASGTAAAHGGSGAGGMMGGSWGGMGGLGGFGLLGGGMLLWPLLLAGLVLLLIYGAGRDGQTTRTDTDTALSELRERYARGDISDEEFESRRAILQQ